MLSRLFLSLTPFSFSFTLVCRSYLCKKKEQFFIIKCFEFIMNHPKIAYILCDLAAIGAVKMDEHIHGLLTFNYSGVKWFFLSAKTTKAIRISATTKEFTASEKESSVMVTIFFKRFSEQLNLFTSDYKGKLPQENNLMRFSLWKYSSTISS